MEIYLEHSHHHHKTKTEMDIRVPSRFEFQVGYSIQNTILTTAHRGGFYPFSVRWIQYTVFPQIVSAETILV